MKDPIGVGGSHEVSEPANVFLGTFKNNSILRGLALDNFSGSVIDSGFIDRIGLVLDRAIHMNFFQR